MRGCTSDRCGKRGLVAWLDPPGGKNRRQNGLKTAQLQQAMSGDYLGGRAARRFAGTPLRCLRHGLQGVGCLKQLAKPVFQQFDGLPRGTELPNPDYRDGSVQVKRWGAEYFHGIDRTIPGNKASRQQPDTITGLNER
jgi:hypothetical protein